MTALVGFWKQAVAAGLVIAMLLSWVAKTATDRNNAQLKQQLSEARLAIVRIEEQVRTRTEQARAQDLANAAMAERRQDAISKEIGNDYQADIVTLRRRYDDLRLRAAEARADQDSGGKPHLPRLSPGAGGIDDRPREDGLPGEDALIASEQALRLKALQDWVRTQGEASR